MGLHHATSNSHPKVIKLLLDHKANVCAEDKFKHTPSAGSPPNAHDCFGRTALHGSAGDDDVTVQRLLLEHGADINIVGDDKKTTLHEAANVVNLANVKDFLSWEDIKTSLQDNDQRPLSTTPSTTSTSTQTPVPRKPNTRTLPSLSSSRQTSISTPATLHEAIVRNRLALVQKWLDRGTSVQVQGGMYGGTV